LHEPDRFTALRERSRGVTAIQIAERDAQEELFPQRITDSMGLFRIDAHVLEGAGPGIPQSHSYSPGFLGDSTTRGFARSSNSIVGDEPGCSISTDARGTSDCAGCDVNE
jgi:hypothetical protein